MNIGKNILRYLIAGVTTSSLLLGVGISSSSAASASNVVGGQESISPEASDYLTEAQVIKYSQLEDFTVSSADSITFDYEGAIAAGVDMGGADDFAYGIELAGGYAAGYTAVSQPESLQASVMAASCPGVNGVKSMWYGYQLLMDSCRTTLIANLVLGGAAAATLTALIMSWTGVGAVAAGVIAAALGIVGAGLSACNSWGQGIGVNVLWTGQPWCWTQ